MENLRELIRTKFGAELDEVPRVEGEICLRRPVFTKVGSRARYNRLLRHLAQVPLSGPRPTPINLGNASDPGGRARRLAKTWVVDHVIRTGVRRANGENMEVASTSLQRGDFVQVSAFADIRIMYQRKRVGTVIQFGMTEVLKLWSVSEAKVRRVVVLQKILSEWLKSAGLHVRMISETKARPRCMFSTCRLDSKSVVVAIR